MLQRSNGAAQYQSAPTGVHVTSITNLRETTPNHSFSTRLSRVIVALLERWNIQLPLVVEEALAPSPTENPMALPTENLQYSLHPPDPPQNHTYHGWCQSAATTVAMAAIVFGCGVKWGSRWSSYANARQSTVLLSFGGFLLFPCPWWSFPTPESYKQSANRRLGPCFLNLLTNGSI